MAPPRVAVSPAEAIRASPTCLCWKRAQDLSPSLRIQQGTFQAASSKGVSLSYSMVCPPSEQPLRGVVLFLHGINEHSERYLHLMEALCGMDMATLTYDLRSHGKSHQDVAGLVAHVENFQECIDDTNDFLTFAKAELYPQMGIDAQLPLIIMGFSLGTLVTTHTILSCKHSFAGVILGGPAMSSELTMTLRIMRVLSPLLSTFFPRERLVPAVEAQWVCRDPLVNADYDMDPLATREMVTCLMGSETLRFMEKLRKNKSIQEPTNAFCKLPLLMMMGSNDKITSLPAARAFYGRVANADKHFETIDGAYHVLFEDFERARVLQLVQEWLHARFPRI